MKLPVTVLLAVKNEAANIARCVMALTPVTRVIVLDSASTDETARIAESLGAEVVQFKSAGGYPKKRQWALENIPIQTEWILFLDADEVVPAGLWREIEAVISGGTSHAGFLIAKGFHFLGHRMRRGGFSHKALLLLRQGKGRFERLVEVPGDTLDMEVHERVIVDGSVGQLKTPLIHEDFKGLAAYIDRHNKYSTWEAHLRHQLLTTGQYGEDSVVPRLLGNAQERRRWLKRIAVRIPGEHFLWFLYHYVICLGFLEGKPGLIACQIRAQYIANVRAKMFELSLQRGSTLSVQSSHSKRPYLP